MGSAGLGLAPERLVLPSGHNPSQSSHGSSAASSTGESENNQEAKRVLTKAEKVQDAEFEAKNKGLMN